MLHRSVNRLSVLAAAFGLIAASLVLSAQDDSSHRARKYKAPPPSARIEVTVLRDVNGKPIENAAVVFHPMEGERDKGAMELKTNEDGKTVIDVLPLGDVVRLQIIARGFQTYGEDFKIDKLDMAIEIKLKRPGEQYSIYKNHNDSSDAPKPDSGATPPPAKDAAPANPGTTPAPSQPQPK